MGVEGWVAYLNGLDGWKAYLGKEITYHGDVLYKLLLWSICEEGSRSQGKRGGGRLHNGMAEKHPKVDDMYMWHNGANLPRQYY